MPLALLVSFLLKIVLCVQKRLSSIAVWELSVFCVGVSLVLMYYMGNFSGNSTAFISETRRLSWCYWSVLKRS